MSETFELHASDKPLLVNARDYRRRVHNTGGGTLQVLHSAHWKDVAISLPPEGWADVEGVAYVVGDTSVMVDP